MSAETSREDPRHIFLEPECCADPSVGRCWAAHNEWPLGDCDVQAEATQYVRADLVAALERERDAATARAEAAEARANTCEVFVAARGTNRDYQEARAIKAEAQRDAAIAERDRMRAALEKAAIAAEVESAGHAIAIIEAALTSAKEPSA